MKKYYVIILCLLFIASVTSYATGREKKAVESAVYPVTEVADAGLKAAEYPDFIKNILA